MESYSGLPAGRCQALSGLSGWPQTGHSQMRRLEALCYLRGQAAMRVLGNLCSIPSTPTGPLCSLGWCDFTFPGPPVCLAQLDCYCFRAGLSH